MSYFANKIFYTGYKLAQEVNTYKPSMKWHLWLQLDYAGRASEWYATETQAMQRVQELLASGNLQIEATL